MCTYMFSAQYMVYVCSFDTQCVDPARKTDVYRRCFRHRAPCHATVVVRHHFDNSRTCLNSASSAWEWRHPVLPPPPPPPPPPPVRPGHGSLSSGDVCQCRAAQVRPQLCRAAHVRPQLTHTRHSTQQLGSSNVDNSNTRAMKNVSRQHVLNSPRVV